MSRNKNLEKVVLKNIFVLLLIFLPLLGACSLKLTRAVNKAPTIKVSHEGKIISLDLENYVACVLAGEVSASWPKEALKAQAVAARTFALLRMKERKNQAFHVQNSVLDQVFKTNPAPSFREAALATFGVVLTQGQKLAETSFHSTCGGKTTDSQSVWGRSYPHLHSVACDFCRASKTYAWEENIPLADFEAKFKQKIDEITVLTRSIDGRALTVELSGNKTRRLSGHELRMAMGAMKIKSTLIHEIAIKGSKVNIKGNGFGHGVGLCQYGALGMAKAGKPFRDILAYYYPGTKTHAMY